MARILVIDDDFNLLQMVKLMLERVGHQVETARDGEKGIIVAGQNQPELAIIDVMMPGLSGYDVVRKLRADPLTARIPIIILTARSQPMDKQMALEAGANAFLSKPVAAQELADRVDAVLKAGVNYRVHTGLLTEPVPHKTPVPGMASVPSPLPPPPISAPPSGGPEHAQRITPTPFRAGRLPIGAEDLLQAADVVPGRAPVVVALGLRGGTGCTTVAVNLAFALAGQSRRVCLADLSTSSGHIPLHLHMTTAQTWGQLVGKGDLIDARTISSLLSQHTASGVAVLAAPLLPADDALTTTASQHVLRELSAMHNPVVVDARTMDSAVQGALQIAAAVLVILSDDPASVQTTAQLLIALTNLGIESGRVRVVLNHTRPTFDLPVETIQKALKRSISTELPYEPKQAAAIRRGIPLVMGNPESPFSAGIVKLAHALGT